MHFFNLDLHIGVIGDIRQIFTALGHEVTDWTISGHAWVLGRKQDHVQVVNQHTWRNLTPGMCDEFYTRYKNELNRYDAFIVTHTPCFSMLYERWNKPIICVASTRYEAPFTGRPEAWLQFNDYLRRKIDSRMLIPVANNKYDAAYAEHFAQREWQVIPSLCNYTGARYTGERKESLYVSKFPLPRNVAGLVDKSEAFKRSLLQRVMQKAGIGSPRQGYGWQEISQFKCAVAIPYNASIMSIFEMYAAGMPMLFPTKRFAMELYREHRQNGVFSELSYNQVFRMPSGSTIPNALPDPNDYDAVDGMMQWIALSDFYDEANLAHLVYFDSFDELGEKLVASDWDEIHEKITAHHAARTEQVQTAWGNVLKQMTIL